MEESIFTYDSTLRKLTVRGERQFPQEVFEYADQVEILDMSDNHLTALPDDLDRLKNMRIAFFSGNSFTEVPPVLATCERLEMIGLKSCNIHTMGDQVLPTGLRGLILTDNKLKELPESIGEYAQLQKLMLTGNQLSALPRSLIRLQKLELIRLAGNRLLTAPNWLGDLPQLAWYADSENDYNLVEKLEQREIPEYSWNDITLGVKIGESAKNSVYKATLSDGRKVAVKLFGQGTTTDGSASNDIVAALRAGNHGCIIGALGKLVGAPHSQEGLVMPLISSTYTSLGLPPDFKLLTRDVYPNDALFLPKVIIRIAYDIATALEHLHAKGVMHGDVYAHNILSKASGESILGDFGAASLYDPHLANETWREKIDVAGYGHLLEELIARVEKGDEDNIKNLQRLVAMCLDNDSRKCPTFTEITKTVQAMS
jgi:hypothetical protein